MNHENTAKSAPLMTEGEVADHLRVKPSTLRSWRVKGVGPVFIRVHSAVRYTEADVQIFIDGNRRTSTSEEAA